MSRGRLAALCAALALAAPVWADPVRIGVRSDARPFVHRDAEGVHSGFLFDLCVEAVALTGRESVLVEVEADDRFRLLEPSEDQIDLLCDPTTITVERAGSYDFTQIVFIANATFLRKPERAHLTGRQTAEAGCAVPSGAKAVAAGWLRGSTSAGAMEAARRWGVIRLREDEVICPVEVERHAAGIARVCDPEGDLSFYFGDGDILAAQVEDFEAGSGHCRAGFGTGFLTYEPYAFAVTDRLPGFRREFQQALYAVFRTSRVAESYAEHFGGRAPADALEKLFLIYRIPAGRPGE
jgi:hypothetical protein